MPHVTPGVRAGLLVLALVVSSPGPAKAQGPAPSQAALLVDHGAATRHAIPVPSAQATRRVAPIVLDGRLDDEGWKRATPVTEFTQVDPDQGKPASQRTEMRFVFDADALYIGAKMYDSAAVRTNLVRRDDSFNSDYIEIVIDGFHDHLSRAFFDVNPSGSKQDQLGIGNSCCDRGWDPIWEAVTRIDPDGWTAEIRIPLSQLRFSKDSVQTWGLQLSRFILRRNELDRWSYTSKTESGGPDRYGHLEGMHIGGSGGRTLELLPYVVGRTSHTAFAPGDPFNNGSVQTSRVGLDLKYLLSSNLTLDATFNPDFGQVEVDPAVINLTAFETSFPEKRPFFIAGSGVFRFGSSNCFFCSNVSSLSAFYSRRIGRAPTGADLATGPAAFADVPDATTIIGAAKITGRTSGGITIGVLDAVTNRATARQQFADGSRGAQEVEPLTNYFVGRIKKDFLRGNLVMGAIGTSVTRQMDTTFAPRLNAHSEVFGADVQYTWDNRVYSLTGNLAVSSITGDPRDILVRQQSSARYFQRPDRTPHDGFLSDRLDPTATTMRGGAAYGRLAKEAGDWRWETALNIRTPGFENNDIAFLQRTDYVWYNANIVRYWTKPTNWYRDLVVIAGGQQQSNFSGDLTDRQFQLFVNSTTLQFWNWDAFYLYLPRVMDDRILRGGPIALRAEQRFAQVDASTNSRSRISGSGGVGYASSELGGWGINAYVGVTWRPTSAVKVSFSPSWNDSQSILQYVQAVTDPTATAFYGRRYVLAGLRQKSVAMDTRLSVTFSPTMTLEMYAQPFVATGQYSDFKEFNAPRGLAFGIYGKDRGTITPTVGAGGVVTSYAIDPDGGGPAAAFTVSNPDFNFRSLRGNVVFRWEYRPGSTLYIAWTHSRSDSQPYGDFSFGRDFDGLWTTRPDNIVLVKASWWINK